MVSGMHRMQRPLLLKNINPSAGSNCVYQSGWCTTLLKKASWSYFPYEACGNIVCGVAVGNQPGARTIRSSLSVEPDGGSPQWWCHTVHPGLQWQCHLEAGGHHSGSEWASSVVIRCSVNARGIHLSKGHVCPFMHMIGGIVHDQPDPTGVGFQALQLKSHPPDQAIWVQQMRWVACYWPLSL